MAESKQSPAASTKRLSLHVSAAFADLLAAAAREDQRSVHGELVYLLRQALEHRANASAGKPFGSGDLGWGSVKPRS